MFGKNLDAGELETAVAKLFSINGYEVRESASFFGAQVDVVARSRQDPFASTIYIEVTTEYVDNTKYGKDLTKLTTLREKDPSCRLLIVSSVGFTDPVMERARNYRVETLTYQELYFKFQQFQPYVERTIGSSDYSYHLDKLCSVYEEPTIVSSASGKQPALEFMDSWLEDNDSGTQWMICVGEYGTGKTALTEMLLRRWMKRHVSSPDSPIPFRIELRDFTKQFDDSSLLHYFLDHNDLSHLQISFISELIGKGRIILLLDGYDEMAAHFNSRERRTCLETLANLSAGGARGILTSRPNYFTEAEELNIVQILYQSVWNRSGAFSKQDKEVIQDESNVDALLKKHFLDRNEVRLSDLDDEQTKRLISKRIGDSDSESFDAVMSVLNRISKADDGAHRNLSGKPVIISYLMEIVDELTSDKELGSSDASAQDSPLELSEWELFELIVAKLMLRDFRRTPDLLPGKRRRFLCHMAARLSTKRDSPLLDEESMKSLVAVHFEDEIRRVPPETRAAELDRIFADLRGSATLTRVSHSDTNGWRFSHNSLREFLLTEHLIREYAGAPESVPDIVVSDAMRTFAESIPSGLLKSACQSLAAHWSNTATRLTSGKVVSLMWPALISSSTPQRIGVETSNLIHYLFGSQIDMRDTWIEFVQVDDESEVSLMDANFSSSMLVRCEFFNVDARRTTFRSSMLDSVSFRGCDLSSACFDSCDLHLVDMTDAEIEGATFFGVDASGVRLVVDSKVLEADSAMGYLQYKGAKLDRDFGAMAVRFSPGFSIIRKISSKLLEGGDRQVRGLTQRGVSSRDTQLADGFVDLCIARKWVRHKSRRELVVISEEGRKVMSSLLDGTGVDSGIVQLLS